MAHTILVDERLNLSIEQMNELRYKHMNSQAHSYHIVTHDLLGVVIAKDDNAWKYNVFQFDDYGQLISEDEE